MKFAWPDVFGFLAAGLLLVTFSMRQMVALRSLAIVSSGAWIVYGWADQIYPVLCLHMVLLPLNSVRLHQALGYSMHWPLVKRASIIAAALLLVIGVGVWVAEARNLTMTHQSYAVFAPWPLGLPNPQTAAAP